MSEDLTALQKPDILTPGTNMKASIFILKEESPTETMIKLRSFLKNVDVYLGAKCTSDENRTHTHTHKPYLIKECKHNF